MTSLHLVRVSVLVALAAVTLGARGGQEVRQDVRIATTVGGGGIVAGGSVGGGVPLAPITSTGTGLILGRVVDAGSGRPVAGALVAIGGSSPAGRGAGGAGITTMSLNGQPVQITQPGGGGAMPRLMTDAEGRFVFRNLPKGSFNLTAVKPGYVDGAYGRLRPNGGSLALELNDGERATDVTIRLFKNASISGIVSDQTGEPVVGVQVRAYRRTLSAGRRVLTPSSGSATTDDRGAYRLFNLIPGEYIVSVPNTSASAPANMQLQGRMSQDLIATAISSGTGEFQIGTGGSQVTSDGRFLLQPGLRGSTGSAPDASGRLLVHQTAYHPASNTVAQAQTVNLASGEEKSGIDIALKLVPTANISGRLLGPSGPVESFMLHLTPTDTGEMSADPDVATAITAADGSFMFIGVPAGQYVIQTLRMPRPMMTGMATMVVNQGGGTMAFTTATIAGGAGGAPPPPAVPPPPPDPTLFTVTPVSVGGQDINDLTISLLTGIKVSGRVEFQGSAERPPGDRLAQVAVNIEAADGKTRAGMTNTRLQTNGLFTTPGVPPGKYLLRVANPPAGWSVRSIMIGGVDASDTPIDLEDRDVGGALITFTDRVSSLSGTVKVQQGAAAGADDAAAVVVFPADNRSWMNYGLNPRRVRMTRTSKSGAYTFNGLPEGDYFVIAIAEEVASEWQDPRFLEAMSREANRASISEGEKRVQDLERRNTRPPGGGQDLATDVGRGLSPGAEGDDAEPMDVDTVAGSKDPAYTEQQTTRDPRATPQTRDRTAEPTTGTGVISGVVVQDDGTNSPMRRARVTLRRAESTAERAVMTDDSGRFSISGLPEGRYTLLAGKAAYLTAYYGSTRAGRGPGSPIALSADQKVANLVLKMARGAVIGGVVRDQFGEPVPNIGVRIMQYQMTSGERRLVGAATTGPVQTDDRGAYRAFGLMPGTYVVSAVPVQLGFTEIRQVSQSDLQAAISDTRRSGPASTTPASAPDPAAAIVPGRSVGYTPVFYPGTITPAEAGQIALTAGQELNGIDLSLRLVYTAKIEGTVMGADGRPASNTQITVLPIDFNVAMPTRSAITSPEGTFTVSNITPGRYTLGARSGGPGPMVLQDRMVFAPAPPGGGLPAPPPPPPPPPPMAGTAPMFFAEQEIDVSGEDLAGIAMTLQPGSTVSGRIVFEGKNATPPADLRQTRVLLTPANQNRPTMGLTPAQIDDAGNFVLQGVPPGQYRFGTTMLAVAAGSGWTLKSATAAGRDVLDAPLEVKPGGNLEGVTLTFTDVVTELSGTLTDGAGKPISDLSILVFTTDRSLWGSLGRRIRPPTQPSSDGKFKITGLPPGEYYLGVVTDVEPGEWTDSAFLDQLAAAAIKVTLGEGEKKVQDIKLKGGQ
ncbi:MAG: carboxypeptidase regulatory-like domain-containing protein [Acidobacteriota bacterium]